MQFLQTKQAKRKIRKYIKHLKRQVKFARAVTKQPWVMVSTVCCQQADSRHELRRTLPSNIEHTHPPRAGGASLTSLGSIKLDDTTS
jgi:ABC-type Na+ transport system ATPase subunit NatA|eukprot:COSAG01_NODE_274_length_19734_cov_122.033512_4_plen_87_part_00